MEFVLSDTEHTFQLWQNAQRVAWDKFSIGLGQVLCGVVLVRIRSHLHLLYGQFTMCSFLLMALFQLIIQFNRPFYLARRNVLVVALKVYFMATAPIAQLEHVTLIDDAPPGGHTFASAAKLLMLAGQPMNMLFLSLFAINTSTYHLCFQSLLLLFNALGGYAICHVLSCNATHVQLFARLRPLLQKLPLQLPTQMGLQQLGNKLHADAVDCNTALVLGQLTLGWLLPTLSVFMLEARMRRTFAAQYSHMPGLEISWHVMVLVIFVAFELCCFYADLLVSSAAWCADMAEQVLAWQSGGEEFTCAARYNL